MPRAGRWLWEARRSGSAGSNDVQDVSTDRSRGRGAGHPITSFTVLFILSFKLCVRARTGNIKNAVFDIP